MAFTAQDVKALREKTGCGMMDCKKALTQANGDMDAAIDFLREQGLAKQAKKASRIAAEGMAYATTNDTNDLGVVIEVNAETDFVAKNDEFQALLQAILVATFLVFLVMAIQFESPRFSFMVMMCIPFALIGSFLLLFITQSTISMVSLMGFLMLMGIVVNNGILFVDSANMLREEGMSTEDALVASGSTRLRPILMTTLTTILSMIPMGLGLGDNGVMMQGMALVIIGGLTASTILTLILIPTFYLIFDKRSRQERRAAKKLAKSQRSGKTGDAENE